MSAQFYESRMKAAEKSGSPPQSSKAKHTEVKIMESFKNTQEQRILSYMKDYGSITQTEAFFDLGVMRLASRISSLRKQGYKIESTLEKVKNRYGESCHIKRYRLSDAEGEEHG